MWKNLRIEQLDPTDANYQSKFYGNLRCEVGFFNNLKEIHTKIK